ncbi:hypothetical protein [Streptomyces sp. HD]|uniref:hypothetical protein n=1 Tax=Streptomyces sp. HD TaxID=3020892 RepID=UPI00232CB098|nr:hypothetical protein [Streptomyces sp. HD]MDC0767296.1 hypothetical protein [Streptomyces sp. HD]
MYGQRAEGPLPVPQVGDGGAASAGAAPGRPFDHRVRVLVEIRDDPDEIRLAEEQFEGRGWPIREPRPGEGPAAGQTPSYVARVVEVRLLGARRGAAAQATWELERLAGQSGLDVIAREAALMRRPETHSRGWEVVPVRPPLRDRVQAVLRDRRWSREDRASREGRASRDSRENRPERFLSVPQASPPSTPGAGSPAPARDTGSQPTTPSTGAQSTAPRTGSQSPPTGTVPLPTTPPTGPQPATPDIRSLSTALDPQPLREGEYRLRPVAPRPYRPPLLLLGIGGAAGAGLGVVIDRFGAAPEKPGWPLVVGLAVALALAYAVGGWGLRHAVLYSAAVRLALPWTIPLAVPVLLAGVPRIGGIVQSKYLSHFGLPDDTVTTDWWDLLGAGVFPAMCALAGFLLIMGTAGFIHRAYARAGTRFADTMQVGIAFGCLAALLLTVVAVGRADARAAADQRALAAGRTPDDFHGLESHFVCIHPISGKPPVYGPLPPATRPVVTFGPQGDRISLWDPKTERALSMRLEDASFVPARFELGRAGCPQAR